MKNLITILCLCSISFSLDCLVGEVDLGWGDCNEWNSNHSDGCMSSGCYSIEETTSIFFYESTGTLLQGEISPNIGELVNLTLVRLDDINQLTGVIPSEIGNLTNLHFLTLENNQLTGVIPLEIGNLTNLEYLKLTNNQVSGDIPSEIWNLTNLRYLYLGGNQLTGEIPSEIENLTSLVDLKLGNNQLTGEIPIELWSMNQNSLDFFDLSNNQLTGEIPDEIENSMFIFSFYLNDNQLSGIIPENTCQIIFLESYSVQFKFGNNNFCPPYPDCLVNQEPFIDENGNGIWDEGESYEDTNLNGIYEENYVGEQDTSGCEELSNSDIYPFEYSLNKSYPNPFNPSTTISFSVPTFDKVSINVYDLKGSLVTTLVDDYYHSGNHIINWDGGNFSSGNYIVKMKSNNYESSQIITLVK